MIWLTFGDKINRVLFQLFVIRSTILYTGVITTKQTITVSQFHLSGRVMSSNGPVSSLGNKYQVKDSGKKKLENKRQNITSASIEIGTHPSLFLDNLLTSTFRHFLILSQVEIYIYIYIYIYIHIYIYKYIYIYKRKEILLCNKLHWALYQENLNVQLLNDFLVQRELLQTF